MDLTARSILSQSVPPEYRRDGLLCRLIRVEEPPAHMDLRRGLTPALLSYEGIQCRYMAPGVTETSHLPKTVRFATCVFGELKNGLTRHPRKLRPRHFLSRVLY